MRKVFKMSDVNKNDNYGVAAKYGYWAACDDVSITENPYKQEEFLNLCNAEAWEKGYKEAVEDFNIPQ